MISRISRLVCASRPVSTSAVRRDSTLSRIKDFVFASEKENFHADFVERAHKWDRISRKEWKLIYRDIGASRSFLLVSTLLPISLVGAASLLFDKLYHQEERDKASFSRKFERDIRELGYLSAIPAVAVVFVALLLLRVHRTRLLRIYQNRSNVEEFIAVRSKLVILQDQMKFHRDVAGAFYYNEDRDVQKLALNFLFGNIQIGKDKFMILDEGFLGNNYRSYMLNETSLPPRLTSQPPK